MARLPRLSVPGLPHLVIQRGNNRQSVALDDEDRCFLLQCWAQAAAQHAVLVHGFVVMDDHVLLLMTPSTEEALGRFMQTVGRRYVRHFNSRHGRFGTLWEGRYRSTVLEPETHLWPCMAYLDLSPVRAGRVEEPQAYPWSSHRHWVGASMQRWLSPSPLHWGLGNTPFAREAAYAALVAEGLSSVQIDAITHAVLHGWALGSPSFLATLQQRTERRLSPGRAGRPRKHTPPSHGA